MELRLWFDHGLGDCANFAHVLELYRRRGHRISLHCADDKAFVFSPLEVARVPVDHPGLEYVVFPESRDPSPEIADQYWLYNKSGANVAGSPLPNIGTPEGLWRELCSVRLNAAPFVPSEDRRSVEEFLRDLPRPIVLLHSMGNTSQESKNVPPDVAIELYRQLLDRMAGTLVLLDWDDRVPRLSNWRVRHMTDDWRWIQVSTLVALMEAADLLISVDSGPLHLARLTDVPIVGLFPTLTKHPARVSLPRGRSVNVVPRDIAHACDRETRILFNIVESPSDRGFDPAFIADIAARMLAGPRYLDREQLGADVQMQQFVLEWERGSPNALTDYNDRHRGFDVLLKKMRARFTFPLVVETGCIRGEEDWGGAGFGTYLLGAYTHRSGGEVVSVDIDADHCAFARRATREMESVKVFNGDSVALLERFGAPIDVLVLDSMDTEIPGHQEHALREAKAGARWLHGRSIILIDDTVYRRREFTGKGALAVPWLQDQGWRVLHSGYQTILVREGTERGLPCAS